MALDGTYTGLKASVADWLNRSDIVSAIPDFISITEAQISRKLLQDGVPLEMIGRSDATIASEFVALPTDFLAPRGLYIQGLQTPLRFVDNPQKIIELKETYPTQQGAPQYCGIVGGQLQFWPWSGVATYSAEIVYVRRIPALSNAVSSNWLLLNHPDAYLYGALTQSAPWLKDDDRLVTWGQIYTTVVADISASAKAAMAVPQIAMPVRVGGTP